MDYEGGLLRTHHGIMKTYLFTAPYDTNLLVGLSMINKDCQTMIK